MRILFLCVANSARSQMAEGLAKSLLGKDVNVQSAGSKPSHVHPHAIQVLSEIGIDITTQKSKSVNDIDPTTIDVVITLCAEEVCPLFLGAAQKIHWPLADPASPQASPEAEINAFRATRDVLKDKITGLRQKLVQS